MHLGLCITLLAFLAVHDCGAQNLAAIDRLIDSVANPPRDRNEALRFEREEIDGIRLSETDAPVRCEFRFRNEGTKPLVITHVATSCGCTVADFDRSPVLPGRQGTVAVIYKPAGQSGKFLRNVFVYTNASSVHPSTRLRLSGEVTAQSRFRGDPAIMGQLRKNVEIAQYQAMQNQLDPHFLFNSLSVLISEIEYDPKNAVKFT